MSKDVNSDKYQHDPSRHERPQFQLRDLLFCITAYAFIFWFASGIQFHALQTALVLALETSCVGVCIRWKIGRIGDGESTMQLFSMRAGLQLTTIAVAMLLSWMSLFVSRVPLPEEIESREGIYLLGAEIGYFLVVTLWHLIFLVASAFLAMGFLIFCIRYSILARILLGVNVLVFLVGATILFGMAEFSFQK